MQRSNLNNKGLDHSNPPYKKSRPGKTKTNSPPPAQAPRPRLPGSLSANTTSSAGGSRDIFAGLKSSSLPPPLATHGGYPLCLPRSSSSADQVQAVERMDASTSASNEHEKPDDIDLEDDDLFGPEPDSESDVAKSKSPSPRQAGFPLCLPSRSTINAAVERSDASTLTSTAHGPVATYSATSPTLDADGIEITTKEVFERAKDAEAANKKDLSKKSQARSGRRNQRGARSSSPDMKKINALVGAPPAELHEDGLLPRRLPRPPDAVTITYKPIPPPPPPSETASFSPFASNDEQGANVAGPSQPRVTPRKSAVPTQAVHPSHDTTVSSSFPLAGPSKRPTATARARARTQRPPRPAGLESHEAPPQAPATDAFWGQMLSKPSPSRSTHTLPGQSDNSTPTASTSSLTAPSLGTTSDKEDRAVETHGPLPDPDVFLFRGEPYKPSEATYSPAEPSESTSTIRSNLGHVDPSLAATPAKKRGNASVATRGRKKNTQGPERQGRTLGDNSPVKKKPVARPRKKPVAAAPTSEESIDSGSQGQQTSTTNTANCMSSTFPAKPRGRTSSTSSEEIPLSSIYHSGVGTGAAAMGSSFTGTSSTLSARQLCGQDCISLDVSAAPQAAHVPVPSTLPKRNAPAAAHRPTPAAKRKRPNDMEDSQTGPVRKAARKHEPESSQAVSMSYTQAAQHVSMGAPTAATTPSGSSHIHATKRKRSAEPEDDSEPVPARKRPVRFSGENSYYTPPPGPSLYATTSSSLDHAMDMEIVNASGDITFVNPSLAANARLPAADIANTVPQDAGYYSTEYFSGPFLTDLPATGHVASATTSAHQASGSSFSGTPFVAFESLGDHTTTPSDCFPSGLAPAVSQSLRPAPAVAGLQYWIPALAPTPAIDVTPSPSPPPTKQWEFFKIADNVYWGPDRESCTQSCPLPYPFGLIMGASTLNFPPGTLQNPETYAPLLDWLGYMMDTRYIPAYRQTLEPLLDWLVYMSVPAPR